MTRISVVRRREESGFALLVIFLIAAAVAFTMYQEMPRAAFESARDKEQLLMDRGNQYKRAIQVFYAVNKRYPQEIKDLENTNDKRYLRRRYIDPMTGKDEWRLVHTNGSFLTDSLVTKPPTQNASNGLPGAGQTPGGGPLGSNNMNTAPAANTAAGSAANTAANPGVNPNDPNAAPVPAPLNAAAQRRPSDRFPTGPGFPQPSGAFTPGGGTNPANFNPDDPSTWPAITLAPPAAQSGQAQQGAAQRPVQNTLGQFAGQGGLNPQQLTLGNTNPSAQNSLVTAQVPDPSAQANAAQNAIVPNGNLLPNSPDTQPTPQPQQAFNGNSPFNPNQFGNPSNNLANAGFNPQNPAPPQSAAITTPATSGLPGIPGGNTSGNDALGSINNALFRPNQPATTGPTGSAGIAGVASTFKGPSIKAYKERLKYQEWEFIYEPAVNQPGAPGQAGASPLGANPLGQPGAQGQNSTGAAGAPATGQAPGQSPSNPFSQTNIFGPQAPTQ